MFPATTLVNIALAVIGLYGGMAYTLLRRPREICIRITLTALRSNVIPMIMREALFLIGAGLAAGIALGLALASLIGCAKPRKTAERPATIRSVLSENPICSLGAGFNLVGVRKYGRRLVSATFL